jgi:hypothetical protein
MTFRFGLLQRVIPAKAGIQFLFCAFGALDSGFRRNDKIGCNA